MAPQHGQLDHRHHRSELVSLRSSPKATSASLVDRHRHPTEGEATRTLHEICITAPAEHRTIMVLRDVSYRIVHNILQRITSAFRTMML
ncbi:hypothetical protein CGCF415_v005757 [Colletotrichum fructicola]|nr:hypothetical protein CGCF415_v005757 [Colletotrichum fructicola]